MRDIRQQKNLDALVGPAGGASEDDRRRAGQDGGEAFEGAAELPWARLADRVVERDDEAGAGSGQQTQFDQLPWLQIVGQRDGTEIMAERRADTGGNREHGGDAGHDGDVDSAPFGRAGLDRLADSRRHGEDTGIAAGNDGDSWPSAALIKASLERASSSRLSEATRVWSGRSSSRSR
ncbi:hypothetical protein AJ88_17500 [Mesorhizobium amorphae CCBAU 01583]|nr:hypothetical protein AJ88_17500 [Mesorhizobium amorphae CCBAU 01583]